MTGTTRRRARQSMAAVALAASVVVAGAAPAAALVLRPTDQQSSVTAIVPSGPVQARVLGGTALVEVRADPGHEVVVDGYDGEPYLRIGADGTVSTNTRSPSAALNQSQNPPRTAPSAGSTSSTAPAPDWRVTGSGGRVQWHDHRLHAAEITAPVDWTLQLTVDGRPTEIRGRLRQLASPSPLRWVGLGAVVALGAWLVGRRRLVQAPPLVLLAAAGGALVSGSIGWASLPAVADRPLGVVALPLGAGAAALAALVVHRPTARTVLTLAAASLLAGWLAYGWADLVNPVLVTSLAPGLDRAIYAGVLGLTVAGAGLAVTAAGSPALAPAGPPGDPGPPAPSRLA